MKKSLVLLLCLGWGGCAGFMSYPYDPNYPYGPQYYQGYPGEVVQVDAEFPVYGGAFYGVEHGNQIKNYSNRGKASRQSASNAGRTSGSGGHVSAAVHGSKGRK